MLLIMSHKKQLLHVNIIIKCTPAIMFSYVLLYIIHFKRARLYASKISDDFWLYDTTSISNLLSTHLILTLYYQHKHRKDIWEKPANCALIHAIDDATLLSWKDWPFLWLLVVSFTLPRLGIQICIMFHFVCPYRYVKHVTKRYTIRSSKT